MEIIPTELPDVVILAPQRHPDPRGTFMETFSVRRYAAQAGITATFVQDNVSCSYQGVLRGLHFQTKRPQGKLVQVIQGTVHDVVVDLRPGSPTWGRHSVTILSDQNHHQLWVPPGFAHGFCVVSTQAIVHYKCTEYHDPDDQSGLAWNCPRLAIPWPVHTPVLSHRDQQWPNLDQWLAHGDSHLIFQEHTHDQRL